MVVHHPPMPASASETKALFEELKTEIRQTKKKKSVNCCQKWKKIAQSLAQTICM